MSVFQDEERRKEAQRQEQRIRKLLERQFADDMREVFDTTAARRVLARFIEEAGIDRSTFRFDQNDRADPLTMAHAAGWQDAARWWLEAIREHCPVREHQMRSESREAARRVPQETEDDDDE